MAKGGGGAWKVAYADFVTAMMAFFLVMWICGQDQKVRQAVSFYFQEPYNTSLVGTSKLPNRTGSVADLDSRGSVPEAESVSMGRGRKSYSAKGQKTPMTRQVSEWLFADDKKRKAWEEVATETRQRAFDAEEVKGNRASVDDVAAQALAKQLQNEVGSEIYGSAKGIQQDLLYEVIPHINWKQIAEDLLAR